MYIIKESQRHILFHFSSYLRHREPGRYKQIHLYSGPTSKWFYMSREDGFIYTQLTE